MKRKEEEKGGNERTPAGSWKTADVGGIDGEPATERRSETNFNGTRFDHTPNVMETFGKLNVQEEAAVLRGGFWIGSKNKVLCGFSITFI